ncbi:MAG: hypothetical protein ACRD3Q_18915 [Terriglobales bacterium]
MPRTTLFIEDDAMKAAKRHAARHGLSLGEAVSELVRQGAEKPLILEKRDGVYVPKLTGRSPKVTTELVNKLREDIP